MTVMRVKNFGVTKCTGFGGRAKKWVETYFGKAWGVLPGMVHECTCRQQKGHVMATELWGIGLRSYVSVGFYQLTH
jgi:hypothetical protein